MAKELGIGTAIVTRARPSLRVLDVQKRDKPATVYNFEVEDFHTYFVGKSALWVHNDCWTERVASYALRGHESDFSHIVFEGIPGFSSSNPESVLRFSRFLEHVKNSATHVKPLAEEGGTAYRNADMYLHEPTGVIYVEDLASFNRNGNGGSAFVPPGGARAYFDRQPEAQW